MAASPRATSGGLSAALLVIAAYTGAALVFTWPLALAPASVLASVQGAGDSYLNLWVLGWDLRVLTTTPSALVTGRIFDAPIFHPAAGALAFSDHLIPQALALAPVYLAGGSVVLCYNLLLVASLVASAAAMHLFVGRVTGSRAGAWLAGLAWGFWPFHFAHLIHLQLQALYLLPLACLALHNTVAGRRRRDAAWLGVAAGLQALASVYYGIIGAVGLGVAAIVLAIAVGRDRDRVLWRRFALAALVGAVLVAPVAWQYSQVQQREGFGRTLFEADKGAAVVASYLQAPPTNLVYGATGLLRFTRREGDAWRGVRIGPEQELWPGLVVLALALFGAWRAWRTDTRPLVATMLAVGVVGFVLSLGPAGIRPLYAAVHGSLFGFQAIRAPARFGVLVMFAAAVLAAVGLRELTRGRPRVPRALVPALVALVALEYLNAPIPYVAAPPAHTPTGAWLAAAPEPGPVAYVPMDLDAGNTPAMLQTLEHGRPTVNGYSGQRPAFYPSIVDALGTFPSGEALATLKDLGVRFVVSAHPVALPAVTPLVERAAFDKTRIYELRWTPETERAIEEPSAPPPPPGPVSFAPGERAVYQVQWIGGPLDLPAGTATLTVGAPAYTFSATAETAEWVSRFFEARDTYTTSADASLVPRIHERHLRQGRRAVDRAFVYDEVSHGVRVGATPAEAAASTAMRLPLASGARDALTTFYYVRTLPLATGYAIQLPLNDAGRNVVLQLTVAGEETVRVGGRDVPTWRLVPRIVERVARHEPLEMVVWVSRDSRRIPVAFEVVGGFGRVRAELIDYRP